MFLAICLPRVLQFTRNFFEASANFNANLRHSYDSSCANFWRQEVHWCLYLRFFRAMASFKTIKKYSLAWALAVSYCNIFVLHCRRHRTLPHILAICIFSKKNPYTLHLDLITQAANSVFVAFFNFLIGAFISDVKKVNYHKLRTISDDLDWV